MLKCMKCGNTEGFMKLECTQIVQEEQPDGEIETTNDVSVAHICERCKGHAIRNINWLE